jgi:hypothetical protein
VSGEGATGGARADEGVRPTQETVPAALLRGFGEGLEELFGFGETDVVGGEAGDFRD